MVALRSRPWRTCRGRKRGSTRRCEEEEGSSEEARGERRKKRSNFFFVGRRVDPSYLITSYPELFLKVGSAV